MSRASRASAGAAARGADHCALRRYLPVGGAARAAGVGRGPCASARSHLGRYHRAGSGALVYVPLAARLLGAGKIRQHDLELGAVQLAGAAAVAALASIPVLLLPGFLEGARHSAAVGWPHCCRRVLRCMGRWRRDPAPLSRLRRHCPGDCWDSRRDRPHVAVVCRRLGKGITSRCRAITTAVFPARARACSPSGVRSA